MSIFKNFVEKVIATYLQGAIVYLAARDVLDVNALKAAAIAAAPAMLTMIANRMPLVPAGLPFVQDLGLRVFCTFAAAAAGGAAAIVPFQLNWEVAEVAWTSGAFAVLAFVKGLIGKKIGDPDSAAWLPYPAMNGFPIADHGINEELIDPDDRR